MLKNKFLILIIIAICIFSFLCGSVYATDDQFFSFTDFYGDEHTIVNLPEDLNNYNHYIIYLVPSVNRYVILPFNKSIKVERCPTSSIVKEIYIDDGPYHCYFYLYSNSTEWVKSDGNGLQQYEIKNTDFKLLYSCSCTRPNSEDLINSFSVGGNDFFLNRQQVLVPIMEKAPLAKVLQEIVKILPAILMTIVGLIGLRKALKFLSTVLHRS